jgi:ribosomal protein S18 acetylase RimI-like enzyme
VACNDKDVAEIYGFICGERVEGLFVLHYIYVKQMYRSLGIGRTLLNMFEHDFTTAALYTHHNRLATKLAAKYNLVHSPYIALTGEYRKEKAKDE